MCTNKMSNIGMRNGKEEGKEREERQRRGREGKKKGGEAEERQRRGKEREGSQRRGRGKGGSSIPQSLQTDILTS